MSRLRFGIAAIATALVTSAALGAQNTTTSPTEPVRCRVQAGFAGTVPARQAVFPVAITIENDVANTKGTIRITQIPDGGGLSEVRHILPFESARNSTKRFVIPVRREPYRKLRVTISFDERIRTVDEEPKTRESLKPLVLCFGLPEAWLRTPAAENYQFINLRPEDAAESAEFLGGVHAAVLTGVSLCKLGHQQLEALRQWTATGGRLVLVQPMRDERLRSFAQALAACGEPGGDPFRRGLHRVGFGMVATGDETDDAPVWTTDRSIGEALFPAEADHRGVRPSGPFGRFCETGRGARRVSLPMLALFLVAYVCAIGPLDRFVVRRIGRPLLTWVFFLVAIVGFSVLAYGYSSVVNVGRMLAVQATVIDAVPEAQTARGGSLFWIYSARNARYTIAATARDVVLSACEEGGSAGAAAGVDITHAGSPSMSARIPVFSAKHFDAAWQMPWPYRVTCKWGDGPLPSEMSLPPELNARAVYIASDDALVGFDRREDGTWKPGGAQHWATLAEELLSAVRGQHRLADPDRRAEDAAAEARAALDKLLLVLSAGKQQVLKPLENAYQTLSDREENLLQISPAVRTPVLLLLLDKAGPFGPVRIEGGTPLTAESTLVRMVLPPRDSPGR